MKNKTYEFVQRIKNHYVGEDCVQMMLPNYLNSGKTLLNSEGMTYHYIPNSTFFVNKYPQDKRRIQFPYSEIPIHKSKVGLKTFEYINQLLDFNRVYIDISKGIIKEYYVIKDGDEALVATKLLLPEKETKYMSRNEVLNLFDTGNGGIFSSDGGQCLNYELPTENEILEWYKKQIIKKREQEDIYPVNEELSEYIYKSLDKLTITDVPSDITMCKDLIFVTIEDEEIKSIKSVIIKFISSDNYEVEIYNFPITIYSLDHMKKLEQTNKTKTREPKFPKSLNKTINRDEIKKSKRLVLSKKK